MTETALKVRLGAHVGQQNMSIKAMRQTWRQLDEHVDWISAWDHLYEAPPQGGTLDHFETVATLAALATIQPLPKIRPPGCLIHGAVLARVRIGICKECFDPIQPKD